MFGGFNRTVTYILYFNVLHIIAPYRYFGFYKSAACIEQVYQSHFFNSVCSLSVSVTFGEFLKYFRLFHYYLVMVICDQQSLILLIQLSEGSDDD